MRHIIVLLVQVFIAFSGSAQTNVGIGNTNPQEKLDVNGGVKVGFTSTTNNGGTIRYNNNEMEYNNGFGWKTMVNSYQDSAITSNFTSSARNAYTQVPQTLTISQPGTYFITYNFMGFNNNGYSVASGNYDAGGAVAFEMNNGTIGPTRPFLISDVDGSGIIRFQSIPLSYPKVVNVSSPSVFSIKVDVYTVGTAPSSLWGVNEAEIIAVRLN